MSSKLGLKFCRMNVYIERSYDHFIISEIQENLGYVNSILILTH